MLGNEYIRWRFLTIHAKHRWRRQMPFNLSQHLKLVAHVHGILVGLDLFDRGRPLAESQLERMEGPV